MAPAISPVMSTHETTSTSEIDARILGSSSPNAPFRQIESVPCGNLGKRQSGRLLVGKSSSGFTLVEVMIFMALLTILMVCAAASLSSGTWISHRLSDYTAAMAVVEAKVEDIRNATYNPPNSPFTSSTVVLTNASSIALNQAGTTFIIPGTVTSTITPIASGHLVTVSGTFQIKKTPLTVTMQTVVNQYSAGQQ